MGGEAETERYWSIYEVMTSDLCAGTAADLKHDIAKAFVSCEGEYLSELVATKKASCEETPLVKKSASLIDNCIEHPRKKRARTNPSLKGSEEEFITMVMSNSRGVNPVVPPIQETVQSGAKSCDDTPFQTEGEKRGEPKKGQNVTNGHQFKTEDFIKLEELAVEEEDGQWREARLYRHKEDGFVVLWYPANDDYEGATLLTIDYANVRWQALVTVTLILRVY